jgi:hypothetical protein
MARAIEDQGVSDRPPPAQERDNPPPGPSSPPDAGVLNTQVLAEPVVVVAEVCIAAGAGAAVGADGEAEEVSAVMPAREV